MHAERTYFLFLFYRRSLDIFTADNVHLVSGFPVQDVDALRVAFYILLPSGIAGGGIIPLVALLQVVNISKSELETALGVIVVEIKGLQLTTPAPSTSGTSLVTNESSTVANDTQPTTIASETTIGPETSDDWKIAVGVVVGVLVIVIIGVVIFCV